MMARLLSLTGNEFWTALANHLWQSTIFAAVVWLVTQVLRKNRAQVRYGLWLAASMKFLIPFSLLIWLGGLLPKQHETIAPQIAMYSAFDVAGQPFSEMTPLPATSTAQTPTWMDRVTALLPVVAMAVWFCGTLTVLLVWHGRWRQVAAMRRRAVAAERGREAEILRRLEESAQGHAPVQLLLSKDLLEPGIFGIFRPILLWPEQLSERLKDEHIESILAHEVMHALRFDNMTAALHMVVEAIFWFHPLVWWMEKRMVEEREQACDEAVVLRGGRAEAYAESLLKACRFCVESPLVCVSGISGADLKKRILRILSGSMTSRVSLASWVLLISAALTAVAAPLVFGQVNRAFRLSILTSPVPPPPPPPPPGSIVQMPTQVVWMTPVYGQILHTAGPRPSFDVVSVRVVQREEQMGGIQVLQDGVMMRAATVQDMAMWAYSVQANSQFSGGPKWMRTAKFDVSAKIDEAKAAALKKLSAGDAERQMRLMAQSLLADRFQLKVNFQMQAEPVYSLVLAKNGLQCSRSVSTVGAPEPPKPGLSVPGPPPPPPAMNAETARVANVAPQLHVKGWPMWMLVTALSQEPEVDGNLVLDRTGVDGAWDCDLSWSREDGPSFFTALQQQLGLKLEATNTLVEVLSVDHVAPPSEN